jgi:undecaprenyl-diphosphatase
MDVWHAIILGAVQGITEFLPISSSGHLVLVREFISENEAGMLAFDAVLHLGTLAAVVIYFWRDLLTLMQTLFRKLGRLPVNEKDVVLLVALAVGTVPAAVAGFFLDDLIATTLFSPISVGVGLILIATLFMYTEWRQAQSPAPQPLSIKTGVMVGLFQACALIPGVSRSGTTIAGGMLLGLSRYEASRFSFLLAIPITAGAAAKMGLELIGAPGQINLTVVAIGAGTAFVLALVVIHWFLAFIRRATLWPFAWYSVVLALLVFYYYLFV